MKLKTRFFAALAVGLLFAVSALGAEIGQPAPAFSLVDTDGQTRSLSEFAGKVVVLEWTNYGCPFVKKHYGSGNMQSLQEQAAAKDVVWLSICSSEPGSQGHMSAAEWKDALKSKGVKASAVLIDESGEVGKSYGAMVSPHMYVIDKSGVLVYDGAIDSIPSSRVSDIERAENYVTAAIDAVLAGRPVEKSKVRPYGCGIKYARN